jgi:hypothetical protein
VCRPGLHGARRGAGGATSAEVTEAAPLVSKPSAACCAAACELHPRCSRRTAAPARGASKGLWFKCSRHVTSFLLFSSARALSPVSSSLRDTRSARDSYNRHERLRCPIRAQTHGHGNGGKDRQEQTVDSTARPVRRDAADAQRVRAVGCWKHCAEQGGPRGTAAEAGALQDPAAACACAARMQMPLARCNAREAVDNVLLWRHASRVRGQRGGVSRCLRPVSPFPPNAAS